ncbi:MAG: HTTM domain-containing protein [bacterium]|nr:HTTM domain-containing protein [bacterium]
MNKLIQFFGLDLRSLAFFRVGLGLLILGDLIVRASALVAHYTDFGVLPRPILLEQFINNWHVSAHLASGETYFQILLFLLAGIFALMLLFGYKTRLATIASWFLLISLHARNPMVLQGGDVLFRMLLFWAMFLPLGARASVDALRKPIMDNPPLHFSAASVALFAQIILVYWMAAAHKTSIEWWSEGSAIYYALSLDQFTTPLGYLLYEYPVLMRGLTWATIGTQIIAPALLISPIWTTPLRWLGILPLAAMNTGMMLTMELGPFPWVVFAGLAALLPSGFWQKLPSLLKTNKQQGLKIYYDADCGFCQAAAQFLRLFLLIPHAKLLPAQSNAVVCKLMEERNSWVVTDYLERKHFQFDGFVALLAASPLFWPLVYPARLRPLAWLGNQVYVLVASHRQRSCQLLPQHQLVPHRSAFLANGIVTILLALTILWNLSDSKVTSVEFPESAKPLMWILRLDQKWDMFSPYPLKEDGWYVLPGTLLDGTEVDVLTGKAVTYEKPAMVSATYPNERWRKYLMNLWLRDNTDHRLWYGKYLCRDWNARQEGEQQLDNFQIIFMKEMSLPNYEIPKPEPVGLWEHFCFKE